MKVNKKITITWVVLCLLALLSVVYNRWGDLTNFGLSALSIEDLGFPLVFFIWSGLIMFVSSKWGKWKAVLIGGVLAPIAIFLVYGGFISGERAGWAFLGIIVGIVPALIASYILATLSERKSI